MTGPDRRREVPLASRIPEENSSMCARFGRLAMLASAASLLFGAPRLLGDEPPRPTNSASSANPAIPAPGHSVHGEPFNEGPRHAAYLMAGMGKSRFPVTTRVSEAQAFFDQGVAQLHSFFYFEAERSFRQAARLDPGCAMTYWGMAMANVNNPRRAREFLKEARKKAGPGTISRREQLYLEALEAFFKDGANARTHQQDLLRGLEAIVQEFPDDIDARAWMVMVAWQSIGGGSVSRQSLDIVLDTVLQVEPMHPGAHHYRIHLWDGVKPIRAEKSAALYARSAPGIAHAWHMPGHTYTGLKRYADAAYQQEGSARVDHAYMFRDRVMPFEIHNYAHNNQWLCTSYSHIGRVRDAIAVARNLAEQPRDPQKNGPNDGGSAQRYGRLRWSEMLARYELWDDLIAANASGALDWASIPQEQVQRAYTLGLAYAARGDAARLAEQVAALRKLTTSEAKAALAELEGRQLLARGEVGPAFEQFAKASLRPEALARAHLAARNFGFAESEAKKAAERDPEQVAPLAGYVEILQAVGKEKEARDAYARLVPVARWADRDLPIFRRLDAIVARWKADASWKAPEASPAPSGGSDETAINRIDLTTLGPLTWTPFPAEPLAGTDTNGRPWSLAAHKGRIVLVLFFLGGKCAHCMQQLQVFGKEYDALVKLGVDSVAVSTDDLETTKRLKNNQEGVKFPMPMIADPKFEAFRRYRAYDDFESQPLHGSFLIDAQGNVRFQRISADPFLDVEFIKAEAARVGRIVNRK
jgi:peroxiredoxin